MPHHTKHSRHRAKPNPCHQKPLQRQENHIHLAAHRWPRVHVCALLELPFRFLRLLFEPIPFRFDTAKLLAKITVLVRTIAGFAFPLTPISFEINYRNQATIIRRG
jgi:hypothetical protein